VAAATNFQAKVLRLLIIRAMPEKKIAIYFETRNRRGSLLRFARQITVTLEASDSHVLFLRAKPFLKYCNFSPRLEMKLDREKERINPLGVLLIVPLYSRLVSPQFGASSGRLSDRPHAGRRRFLTLWAPGKRKSLTVGPLGVSRRSF